MNIFQRIGIALATGYIWCFTGERVFWSFWRAENTLPDLLLTWLLYSLFAYICLICISEFRVRSFPAIFLVGALFGWLVEGLFALTMYGAGGIPLPFSISWTGLAWHATFIGFAWYWMRTQLQSSTKKTILGAAVLGVLWGVWSLAWIFETPPVTSTAEGFLGYGLMFTAFYILALHAYAWFGKGPFRASRIEKTVLAVLCLAYFALVTVPTYQILALVGLPVLFLLIYIGLRKNRTIETSSDILVAFQTPVPWGRSLILFMAPIIAVTIFSTDLHFRSNILFLGVLTPLGFALFLWSFWRIFWAKSRA